MERQGRKSLPSSWLSLSACAPLCSPHLAKKRIAETRGSTAAPCADRQNQPKRRLAEYFIEWFCSPSAAGASSFSGGEWLASPLD